MDFYLQDLERKSIYIFRKTKAEFKNAAVLWSANKSSIAMLYLCKKAFFGKIPFPVIYVDKGNSFPESYKFRDKIVKEWGINLLNVKVGLEKDTNVDRTEILKEIMVEKKFDAMVIADKKVEERKDYVQIHPLLDWRELDIWQYIKEKDIPLNPLYFAKNARTVDEIIKDLEKNQPLRTQDEEKEQIKQRLRQLGYM